MIVLLAVDNGLDKAISQSVITMKFPDDTEFQFGQPTNGWVAFWPKRDKSDPLAQKSYYFQAAYVIGIMADDQPAQDAIPQMLPEGGSGGLLSNPSLAELRKRSSY